MKEDARPPFSYQKRSALRRRENCSAIRQANVGPTMPSRTGISARAAGNKSTSLTSLRRTRIRHSRITAHCSTLNATAFVAVKVPGMSACVSESGPYNTTCGIRGCGKSSFKNHAGVGGALRQDAIYGAMWWEKGKVQKPRPIRAEQETKFQRVYHTWACVAKAGDHVILELL